MSKHKKSIGPLGNMMRASINGVTRQPTVSATSPMGNMIRAGARVTLMGVSKRRTRIRK